MKISLIYNYYEGGQDLSGTINLPDTSMLKTKKHFIEWLLNYFPNHLDEYYDFDEEDEYGDDSYLDDAPFNKEKIKNLFYVSICLYWDKSENEIPKWYNELNGRIYFINEKPTTWKKALKFAGL